MKILLAFDSFKGSLTAPEAVAAARNGVRAAFPEAEIVGLPLADGGEGTTAALCRLAGARWKSCQVHDPLFREILATYAVSPDGETAYMEMASAAGLTLLADGERDPKKTTTFGVGEMLLDAVACGCSRLFVGIGGSATNDGGMGALAALGVRFLDTAGRELQPVGGNLSAIQQIDWSGLADLHGTTIEVVCDVQNPLFGPEGAAHVYAPQKGADAAAVAELDAGLRHFAERCAEHADLLPLTSDAAVSPATPGAGAAGGLGYGLMLLGAKLRRGVDVVLDMAEFDRHLQQADLVITGEGKADLQTLNGKLPCGVLQRAKAKGTPVALLAGKVEDVDALTAAGFCVVRSIHPASLCLSQAMTPSVARRHLALAVQATARHLEALPVLDGALAQG